MPIQLRRRLASEAVREALDEEILPRAEELTRDLAGFAEACDWQDLARSPVARPDGLRDRAWDISKPLFQIAALAGDEWPARLESACSQLLGAKTGTEARSRRIELLADIRDLFASHGVDRFSSAELVAALTEDPESPWTDAHQGKPLTQRGLARLLEPLEIRSRSVRLPDRRTPKGYLADQFADAFARYLGSETPHPQHPMPDTGNPTSQVRHNHPNVAAPESFDFPSPAGDVADVAPSDLGSGGAAVEPCLVIGDVGYTALIGRSMTRGHITSAEHMERLQLHQLVQQHLPAATHHA